MSSNGAGKSDNPYAGDMAHYANTPAGQQGLFSGSMPTGKPQDKLASQQVYGSSSYYNQTLKGHSESAQNIITNEQLAAMSEGMAPVTSGQVERLRREHASTTTSATPPAYNLYNSAAYNQLYMRPVTSASVSPAAQDASAQTPPDLTTAEGSIDYLNQIAPKDIETKSKLPVNSKLFVIVGVALVVIVIIGAVGAALGGSSVNISAISQRMGKNLANMQEILDYGDDNDQYTSGSLVAVTAETKLVMLSHQKELGKVIPLAVDEDGKVTDAEADENITEDLEKAKAQGTLDKVYRDKLKKELESIASEADEIYRGTRNEDIIKALESTYKDVIELEARVDAAQINTGGSAAD